MAAKARLESMLFTKETVYMSDYQHVEFTRSVPTKYQAKPDKPRPAYVPKDVHTITVWKNKSIPFYLLHKPRPIIDTNPHCPQKRYEKPSDPEREEAQRTRPRLVMTPAVSMDDIADPRTRHLLCADMYVSDIARAQREAIAAWTNVQAPLPDHPAPANPITLQKLQLPYVAPEWRKETVSWDQRQLRAHCDPSNEFWQRMKMPKCRACEESAAIKSYRRMFRQK